MKITISQKVTTWESVHLYDEDAETFLEKFKGDAITHREVDEFISGREFVIEYHSDSSQYMEVEDNGDKSTLEVFNEDNRLIWNNESKQWLD